jgi:hypothetical protein
LIKEFLGIEIESEQIFEIGEMPQMNDVRKNLGKQRPGLFEICNHLEIECSHKGLMDDLSIRFRSRPDVMAPARRGRKN